ncbi:hypothetical protein ABVT39_012267 [Epinephelus coioides]
MAESESREHPAHPPTRLPPNPPPQCVSPARARPSSAAIGFDFLAAVWSLHTFNKLCHFTVQTGDAMDKPVGLVCGIKDLIRIDQSFAKELGPSASRNALQCHNHNHIY